MNRRRADAVVGLLVAAILVVGGALSLEAFQRQQAFEGMGSMMGTSMEAVHGTNPLWYVLGTVAAAAVVGGLYLVVREEFTTPSGQTVARTGTPEPPSGMAGESEREGEDSTGPAAGEGAGAVAERPRTRTLDLLPEDERRILEPVLDSPGITQIELRDRADFSKSKVSQTVSDLEKRGLLVRERQGRTYRIYPSDDLQADTA